MLKNFLEKCGNYISKEEYNGKGKLNTHPQTHNKIRVPIQIARSITPETLSKKGELGIFEGYRKSIRKAEDFIYLENQYFINKVIVKALKKRLKSNPDLQLIVVMKF